MFKSYLKIALRVFLKHRAYSLINMVGLAVGIACAILILLWVQDETSFDRFHENADRVFRVSSRGMIGNTFSNHTQTPPPFSQTLQSNFPEVENAVRLYNIEENITGRYGDKIFNEGRLLGADSTFFEVFSFSFLKGDPRTALVEPLALVVTEETARRYFGDEDPLGKTIVMNDQFEVRVSGVIENVPPNSHFHFDMLLSMTSLGLSRSANWGTSNLLTYILLREGATRQHVEAKLPGFVEQYVYETLPDWFGDEAPEGNYWEFFLQPLTDIHLKSDLNGEFEANGNMLYVYIFSLVAFMIILVACINFMNLTTARSANRAKEVGLRKVVGSTRRQLIFQYMTESFSLVLMALFMTVLIVYIALPYFNNFTGKSLEFSLLNNVNTVVKLLGLFLFVGLLSGSYPALYLSSFQPIAVLTGKVRQGLKHSALRNALVVFQFGTTIILFIGTFIVAKQLDFFQDKWLGFNKEQVLVIKNPNALGEQASAFKNALRQHASITAVAGSRMLPGRDFYNISFEPEGQEEITLNVLSCEPEFAETMQLEMVEGRFLSREFATDRTAIVLNETAVRLLQWEEPIGKTVLKFNTPLTVVGVVKDFHFESLHATIRPMVVLHNEGPFQFDNHFITVRVNTEDIAGVIEAIAQTWRSMTNGNPFDYSFLDEDYEALYWNEMLTGNVFLLFSILAVFIATLGLLGLALYTAEQRTKEIGIRKVLGASESTIFLLLSKEFVKWVVLSNIIAWPVAYFSLRQWLQSFAYQVTIGWTPFLFSAVLVFGVALITVSYRAAKAARVNPVDSLRYE